MSNGLPAPRRLRDRTDQTTDRTNGQTTNQTDRLQRRTDVSDLLPACILAAVAAVAYAFLADGSALRVALTVPVLFVVPGYLLIEAVSVTVAASRRRATHAWVAVGVSPAVVGLLALATVFLPGGFQAATIVGVVTATCFALAGCAFWRRRTASAPVSKPRSKAVIQPAS